MQRQNKLISFLTAEGEGSQTSSGEAFVEKSAPEQLIQQPVEQPVISTVENVRLLLPFYQRVVGCHYNQLKKDFFLTLYLTRQFQALPVQQQIKI